MRRFKRVLCITANSAANVRIASKREVEFFRAYVGFGRLRTLRRTRLCRRGAQFRTSTAVQQFTLFFQLLDHLFGDDEQRWRDDEAECLGSCQV